MASKQTLFIPDNIIIELRNKNNEILCQKDILIGIHSYAFHKNNIDLYPFLSNEEGLINITKQQIIEAANTFISYGLMDYAPLEFALPVVKLYFFGNESINRYLNHNKEALNGTVDYDIFEKIAGVTDDFLKGFESIVLREKNEYLIFETCFNRNTTIEENIIFAKDTWDKPRKEVFYKANLPL